MYTPYVSIKFKFDKRAFFDYPLSKSCILSLIVADDQGYYKSDTLNQIFE